MGFSASGILRCVGTVTIDRPRSYSFFGYSVIPSAIINTVARGITRCAVMQLAREQGYPVEEDVLTRHDLYNAQECFLTGTAAEIVPVVRIDGRAIGTAKPGPVTRELREAFGRLTCADGERYTLQRS